MEYLIHAFSESSDNYFFLSDHEVTNDEFEEWVKINIPEEVVNDCLYIHIVEIIPLKDLPKI